MTSQGLRISKPLPQTAAVAAWPAVERRALTREAREWLEAVPAAPGGMVWVTVRPTGEGAGVTAAWVRRFFCGYIEGQVRAGLVDLRREGDELVAVRRRTGCEHRVSLRSQVVREERSDGQSGTAHRPPAALKPLGGAAGFSFSRNHKGGTYAAHCCPRERD